MKTNFYFNTITAIFIALCVSANLTIAQFNLGIAPDGRTNNVGPGGAIQNIGIGYFPAFGSVRAKLHVNSFFLNGGVSTATPPVSAGEIFRTDGFDNVDNAWRMFTGISAATTTEKFNINIPATSNNVNLTVFQNGNMNLLTNNIQRAIILGSNGFMGIGDNFLTPQNRLHLNETTSAPFYAQWTDFTTGNTSPNDGFKVGINSTSGFSIAELRQQEDAPIDIFTNTTFTRKMRIAHSSPFHPLGGDLPRVGIGTVDFPLAYLHIGLDKINPPNPNANTMGFRTWMDKGVFMVGGPIPALPNIGTDNMYMGLKEVTTDRTDAIINWGNNPFNDPSNHGDRLLFVFTADPLSGFNASTPDGLETARMISDGNISMTGIGGDPIVNPYSFPFAGPPAGSDPGNTVEINSPVTTSVTATPVPVPNTTTGYLAPNSNPLWASATGFSGLRFTDLTSGSAPVPTGATGTTTNVLSVDNNGDVILVPGGGIVGYCSPGPLPSLTSPAGTNLNGNNFYFEGNGSGNSLDNSVIIGRNCFIFPFAKLDVFQNSASPNTIGINIENRDASSGTVANPIPVIGIKSTVTNAGVNFWNVAGWFEAPPAPKPQFALFVPGTSSVTTTGGTVDIGYPYATANPDFILDVNGKARIGGITIGSDSILKTNVSPFNAGLNVVRNLNPKFYHYNGKCGFDTEHQYIGIMAQDIASLAPFAIDSSF